LEYKLEIS